ncbi:hypothetical protein VTK73DRAFT_5303 [Phialemonium thermophilum]|uniref:Alpha/beta hydrolase fold-3 domain-containing protein n=1 Tax=Phialemonium thermophilum TaxID=223376 RepID=A0ABR3V219_9PEZI
MVDGGPLSHLWLCELFATYGGVAVEVQFRLAPEHVFPTAVLDAYDGLKWTAENYVSLGANPSKGFIVAGESTGADIALVIAHLYADEARRPALTGLYVACPHAMEPDTVPDQYRDRFVSREQNADAFILKADSIEFIKSMYKPDTKSSLFHAVNFPDHSKMPKTYFQACGADPTRDGVLILDQLWRDCGVETKIDVYPGLPHHFWTLFIHARFTQKHAEDSQRALSWLLGSESGWGPKKPKPGETTEGEASA